MRAPCWIVAIVELFHVGTGPWMQRTWQRGRFGRLINRSVLCFSWVTPHARVIFRFSVRETLGRVFDHQTGFGTNGTGSHNSRLAVGKSIRFQGVYWIDLDFSDQWKLTRWALFDTLPVFFLWFGGVSKTALESSMGCLRISNYAIPSDISSKGHGLSSWIHQSSLYCSTLLMWEP